MDPTLAGLLDEHAVQDVLTRYFESADDRDRDRLGTVFHDDATVDYAGFFTGPASEFVAKVDGVLLAGSRTSLHTPSRVSMAIDGDVADTRTTAVAYLVREDGRVDVVVATYVDRMERRAGEWRIAARQCRVEWTAALQETTSQEHTAGAS